VPCLIPDFYPAAEAAFVVVAVETAVICRIRTRYLDTPFTRLFALAVHAEQGSVGEITFGSLRSRRASLTPGRNR
jgi:hypothetical protein